MNEKGVCLHEEQIQKHSQKIERVEAELNYKKERLDELKKDNERMEGKIDDIKDCMNQLILKSNQSDSALETRLVAIETKQKDLEKKVDDNKKDNEKETNQKFVRIGLILSGLTILISLGINFLK